LFSKWEFDISVIDTAGDEDYMISKTRHSDAHRCMRDKRRALEKLGNAQLAGAALTDKDDPGEEETKEEGVEDNGQRKKEREMRPGSPATVVKPGQKECAQHRASMAGGQQDDIMLDDIGTIVRGLIRAVVGVVVIGFDRSIFAGGIFRDLIGHLPP
jgi:hypothetical protein